MTLLEDQLAVTQNGLKLQFVVEQNDEICKLAVTQNGLALQFVVEQNDEICKLAVTENGLALIYVLKKTDEICTLAVTHDGLALQFVVEQNDEICQLAVQQDGLSLKFVKEQTDKICTLAVQQNVYALQFCTQIKNINDTDITALYLFNTKVGDISKNVTVHDANDLQLAYNIYNILQPQLKILVQPQFTILQNAQKSLLLVLNNIAYFIDVMLRIPPIFLQEDLYKYADNIIEARAVYNELTSSQFAVETQYQRLGNLETQLSLAPNLALTTVFEQIVTNITLDLTNTEWNTDSVNNKIEEANLLYDKLNNNSRNTVMTLKGSLDLAKTNNENKITEENKFVNVVNLNIRNLTKLELITTGDNDKIQEARTKYNNLNSSEKKRVEHLSQLIGAEQVLEVAKNEKLANDFDNNVLDMIQNLNSSLAREWNVGPIVTGKNQEDFTAGEWNQEDFTAGECEWKVEPTSMEKKQGDYMDGDVAPIVEGKKQGDIIVEETEMPQEMETGAAALELEGDINQEELSKGMDTIILEAHMPVKITAAVEKKRQFIVTGKKQGDYVDDSGNPVMFRGVYTQIDENDENDENDEYNQEELNKDMMMILKANTPSEITAAGAPRNENITEKGFRYMQADIKAPRRKIFMQVDSKAGGCMQNEALFKTDKMHHSHEQVNKYNQHPLRKYDAIVDNCGMSPCETNNGSELYTDTRETHKLYKKVCVCGGDDYNGTCVGRKCMRVDRCIEDDYNGTCVGRKCMRVDRCIEDDGPIYDDRCIKDGGLIEYDRRIEDDKRIEALLTNIVDDRYIKPCSLFELDMIAMYKNWITCGRVEANRRINALLNNKTIIKRLREVHNTLNRQAMSLVKKLKPLECVEDALLIATKFKAARDFDKTVSDIKPFLDNIEAFEAQLKCATFVSPAVIADEEAISVADPFTCRLATARQKGREEGLSGKNGAQCNTGEKGQPGPLRPYDHTTMMCQMADRTNMMHLGPIRWITDGLVRYGRMDELATDELATEELATDENNDYTATAVADAKKKYDVAVAANIHNTSILTQGEDLALKSVAATKIAPDAAAVAAAQENAPAVAAAVALATSVLKQVKEFASAFAAAKEKASASVDASVDAFVVISVLKQVEELASKVAATKEKAAIAAAKEKAAIATFAIETAKKEDALKILSTANANVDKAVAFAANAADQAAVAYASNDSIAADAASIAATRAAAAVIVAKKFKDDAQTTADAAKVVADAAKVVADAANDAVREADAEAAIDVAEYVKYVIFTVAVMDKLVNNLAKYIKKARDVHNNLDDNTKKLVTKLDDLDYAELKLYDIYFVKINLRSYTITEKEFTDLIEITYNAYAKLNLCNKEELQDDVGYLNDLNNKVLAYWVDEKIKTLKFNIENNFIDNLLKEDIKSTRTKYTELSSEAKKLVTQLKKLENAEHFASACEVYAQIDNINLSDLDLSEITANTTIAIKIANDMYNMLDPLAKILVKNFGILIRANAVLIITTNTAAAKNWDALVALLPVVAIIGMQDNDKIVNARVQYEKLNPESQTLVNNISILINAETALLFAKNYALANNWNNLVKALPAVLNIGVTDAEKIDEALQSYNNLTSSAKILTTMLPRLETIQNALDRAIIVVDANKWDALVIALPSVNKIGLDNKAAINNIIQEYTKLNDATKQLLKEKFNFDEAQKALQEATDVKDSGDWDKKVTELQPVADIGVNAATLAIKNVTESYTNLSPESKNLVTKLVQHAEAITALLDATDDKNAKDWDDLVGKFPDEIGVNNAGQIREAYGLYDKLTPSAEKKVTKLNKFTNACATFYKAQLQVGINENTLKEASDFTDANAWDKMVRALQPVDIIGVDAATFAINNVNKSYTNLSPESKNLVTTLVLQAEAITALLNATNHKNATAWDALVDNFPEIDRIGVNNAEQINDAYVLFNKLTPSAEEQITKLEQFTDARAALKRAQIQDELNKANQLLADTFDKIVNALPLVNYITLANKKEIDDTWNIYKNLTEPIKNLIKEKNKIEELHMAIEMLVKNNSGGPVLSGTFILH